MSSLLLVQAVLKGAVDLKDAYRQLKPISKKEMFNELLISQSVEKKIELSDKVKQQLDMEINKDQDDDQVWDLWQDIGGEAGEGS